MSTQPEFGPARERYQELPGWQAVRPYTYRALDELHPGEQHGSLDTHCINPKCEHNWTPEEHLRLTQYGQITCPNCGTLQNITGGYGAYPSRENQQQRMHLEYQPGGGTHAGLTLAAMGQIGEQIVHRISGLPCGPVLKWFGGEGQYHSGVDMICGDGKTNYGVEVKTIHSLGQPRFKLGNAADRQRMIAFCGQQGLRQGLVGVRLNFYTDKADVFFREGFTDTFIGASSMQFVGTFDFADLNPFRSPSGEHQVPKLPTDIGVNDIDELFGPAGQRTASEDYGVVPHKYIEEVAKWNPSMFYRPLLQHEDQWHWGEPGENHFDLGHRLGLVEQSSAGPYLDSNHAQATLAFGQVNGDMGPEEQAALEQEYRDKYLNHDMGVWERAYQQERQNSLDGYGIDIDDRYSRTAEVNWNDPFGQDKTWKYVYHAPTDRLLMRQTDEYDAPHHDNLMSEMQIPEEEQWGPTTNQGWVTTWRDYDGKPQVNLVSLNTSRTHDLEQNDRAMERAREEFTRQQPYLSTHMAKTAADLPIMMESPLLQQTIAVMRQFIEKGETPDRILQVGVYALMQQMGYGPDREPGPPEIKRITQLAQQAWMLLTAHPHGDTPPYEEPGYDEMVDWHNVQNPMQQKLRDYSIERGKYQMDTDRGYNPFPKNNLGFPNNPFLSAFRYPNTATAIAALDEAEANRTAQYFRASAKWPTSCSCCGKRIQPGQMVAKVAPGRLLGVCCVTNLFGRAGLPGYEARTSATMYHISPRPDRESILANGLDWQRASKPLDGDFERANYLFRDDPSDWASQHPDPKFKDDVWAVNVDGLPIEIDPDHADTGAASLVRDTIPPERLRLMTAAKLAAEDIDDDWMEPIDTNIWEIVEERNKPTRDPDWAYVYFQGALKMVPWTHNVRHAELADQLLKEWGYSSLVGFPDIAPTTSTLWSTGNVYEMKTGDPYVDVTQLADPEVTAMAITAIKLALEDRE